jgi:hypothetical protein
MIYLVYYRENKDKTKREKVVLRNQKTLNFSQLINIKKSIDILVFKKQSNIE